MHFILAMGATHLTVHLADGQPLPEHINAELTNTFQYSFQEYTPASRFSKGSKPSFQKKTVFVYNAIQHSLPWGLYLEAKKLLSQYGTVTVKDVAHEETGGRVRPKTYRRFKGIPLAGQEEGDLVVADKKELRYYQDEAVSASLKGRYGTIYLGTGAGKTEVFANVIERARPQVSLVVVDGTLLLNQTIATLKRRFPRADIKRWDSKATATQKKNACTFNPNIMTIVVSSYQTFNNYKHESCIDDISHVLMDEIQKIACDSYSSVVVYTPYAYSRLGFSATPFKDDNSSINVIGYCGPVLYHKPAHELVTEGYLARPLLKVANLLTPQGFLWLIENSKYHKIVCFHEQKTKGVESTRFALEQLCEYLPNPEEGRTFLQNSWFTARSDKSATSDIEAFTKAKTGCIFITPMLSAGVDIPDISIVVLMKVRGQATGAMVENIQRIGRALRPHIPNKVALVVVNQVENKTYLDPVTGEVKEVLAQPTRPNKLYQVLTTDSRAYGDFDHSGPSGFEFLLDLTKVHTHGSHTV